MSAKGSSRPTGANGYTDGLGYAKLDRRGASCLAAVIDGFGDRRTRGLWTRLVLMLYASLDAKTATTAIGPAELAERASCTRSQAARFLERMERDGAVVAIGEAHTGTGVYVVRTFKWLRAASRLPKGARPLQATARGVPQPQPAQPAPNTRPPTPTPAPRPAPPTPTPAPRPAPPTPAPAPAIEGA